MCKYLCNNDENVKNSRVLFVLYIICIFYLTCEERYDTGNAAKLTVISVHIYSIAHVVMLFIPKLKGSFQLLWHIRPLLDGSLGGIM